MPQTLRSWSQIADENWLPLSVVTALGMPKEDIHPCANASMMDSVVMSFSGIAAGHRVNRSTMVSRYRNPFDSGIIVRSAWICANRLSGTSNSPIFGTVCRRTLACWHGTHSRAHLATSAFIDGQTNFCRIVWRVRSTPGCPNPCIASKILRRQE